MSRIVEDKESNLIVREVEDAEAIRECLKNYKPDFHKKRNNNEFANYVILFFMVIIFLFVLVCLLSN